MCIIIEITPDLLKLIIRLAMLGGGVTGFSYFTGLFGM